MVILHTDPQTQSRIITIKRNCSLSWGEMKVAFGVLFAIILAVALYFVIQGAWLVAPFSGIEILVLGAGMYLSAHSGAKREIIRIEDDAVIVYRGSKTLDEIVRFHRSWTTVGLSRDPNDWYPSKLFLRSHGKQIEVGSGLIETERAQLATDLDDLLSDRSEAAKDTTFARKSSIQPC